MHGVGRGTWFLETFSEGKLSSHVLHNSEGDATPKALAFSILLSMIVITYRVFDPSRNKSGSHHGQERHVVVAVRVHDPYGLLQWPVKGLMVP